MLIGDIGHAVIAKADITTVLAVISAKPVNMTITLSAVSLLVISESNNIRIRILIGRFILL